VIRIVALDPGGTTGWATWTDYPLEKDRWKCGHIGPEPHHNALDQFLGMQQTNKFVIVCESFEYRNQSRAGLVLDSCEYIGVVKRFCQERGVLLHMQTAAMGKGFVKDNNLRALGLWSGARWKHAMDARRHLLYYMVGSKNTPTSFVAPELRLGLLRDGWK